ncbi:MAG TPA: phage holin family protein [Thermoanaerobaculia bacterium]|nr:phage holin family protein [Thermoanaerobaculia bacterium]
MNVSGTSNASLGTLVKGLLEDVSTLFRSEIALAKIEIRQSVAGMGGVAALFALALLFAMLGLAFIFVVLVLLLALVMPAWASALVVAVTLFILAAAAGFFGYRKMQATKIAPVGAIRGMREDVDLIRNEIQRVRGRDDEDE